MNRSGSTDDAKRRPVRSFVQRGGRLTPAQRRALADLLPRYQVAGDCRDVRTAFDRPAELVVEVGFGNGQALLNMAESEAQRNFLGIEVHPPGVGRLLNGLDQRGLGNVRVAMGDAVEVIERQMPPSSVAEFRIYFPDPWPKKRHHKRRLIQGDFLHLLSTRLGDQGLLHLATDWLPYAEWMVEQIERVEPLNLLGDPWVARPPWRPITHFERRGRGKGHQVFDLLTERRARQKTRGAHPVGPKT